MSMRALILFLVAAGGTVQAGRILTLDPVGGALSGPAGSTVGWGFTITNDTDYLLVTGALYTTTTGVGVFTDFISSFNFIVAGPGTTPVSQAFSPGTHSGVGAYAIDSGSVPGALSIGTIHVIYDVYSVNPNDLSFNPDTDLILSGEEFLADASVQVEDIPEPSSVVLIGAAALLALCVPWPRRQSPPPGK